MSADQEKAALRKELRKSNLRTRQVARTILVCLTNNKDELGILSNLIDEKDRAHERIVGFKVLAIQQTQEKINQKSNQARTLFMKLDSGESYRITVRRVENPKEQR